MKKKKKTFSDIRNLPTMENTCTTFIVICFCDLKLPTTTVLSIYYH